MDRWYDFWLFLHLAAVVLGLGPSVATAVVGARIQRAPIPARLPLTEAVRAVAVRVIEPASAIVLVTGLILLVVGPWETSDAWVILGLAGWALMLGVGLFALRPISSRMIAIQENLSGPPSEAEAAELESLGRRAAMFGGIEHVLLALVILDMVFKPGL